MPEEIPDYKIPSLIKEFHDFPVDRSSIPKSKLDLEERSRKSLFQWSGQFPPELVEVLLDKYSKPNSVILDPFVGSGTTLFEAAHKSRSCLGSEISPAAVELARTAVFCNLKKNERKKYLDTAMKMIEKNLKEPNSFDSNMRSMLKDASKRPLVYNILANVLMRASLLDEKEMAKSLTNAFNIHKKIINELPYSVRKCVVFKADARSLPIKNRSVDLVLTSPPYPGVFNYSRNYKKALWLAGFKQSEIDECEIGSDKKNLGNRFLTIIQYSIDMSTAMKEIKRTLKESGRIIVVIGRESRIKNIGFENSALLYALAAGQGFQMVLKQERGFASRSGAKIYEDILHFVPTKSESSITSPSPMAVGSYFLRCGLKGAEGQVSEDLSDAIALASKVQPSTILKQK